MDILTEKEKQLIKNILNGYPQIVAGYIFGSRVKKNEGKNSDLDIGIVCFGKDMISPVELSFKISRIIKRFRVDVRLVDIYSDPVFLSQVIGGKLIYQKSLKDRIALETKILHFYEDFKHFASIKKYYLEKSFKEGIYAH